MTDNLNRNDDRVDGTMKSTDGDNDSDLVKQITIDKVHPETMDEVIDPAIHPVCEIFPMMSEVELAELTKDIKDRGLLEPIWLDSAGKIIDGRNRYRACKKASIEPIYRTWNGGGELLDFVLSLNLRRRHLNESQRAIAAAKACEYYKQNAKERQGTRTDLPANLPESVGGEWREKAGQDFMVSPRSVQHAATVVELGVPELINAVETGEAAISAVAEVATLPNDQQRVVAAGGKKEIATEAKRLRQKKKTMKKKVDDNKSDIETAVCVNDPFSERQIIQKTLDQVIDQVTAATVDLVIAEGLPNNTHKAVREAAAHVLRPGGSLFCVADPSIVPAVVGGQQENVKYHWTLAGISEKPELEEYPKRHVKRGWLPIIWYVRENYEGSSVDDVFTVPFTVDSDGHLILGNAGLAILVSKFSIPDQTVLFLSPNEITEKPLNGETKKEVKSEDVKNDNLDNTEKLDNGPHNAQNRIGLNASIKSFVENSRLEYLTETMSVVLKNEPAGLMPETLPV